MPTLDAAAEAAATQRGNMIFWVVVAVFLAAVGLFMLDQRNFVASHPANTPAVMAPAAAPEAAAPAEVAPEAAAPEVAAPDAAAPLTAPPTP